MEEKAISVLDEIEANGFKAYIVGGFIRDKYLGIKSNDVDICTNATPLELKKIFENAIIPKKCYGAVLIKYKLGNIEITTFRKESSYDEKRNPTKTEYVESLYEDVKRRDFTINTICMDKDYQIIDLMNGKADIKKKTVRMVGDPKKRLKEDPLRILRAIRFAAVYNFKIDRKLSFYIKKYAYLVESLSYDRKKNELDKIFHSNNKRYGINLLLKYNLHNYLDIPKLKYAKITSSAIGIWAELDAADKYNFTASERKLINGVNALMTADLYDPYVLYKNGLYIAKLAGEIRGLDIVKMTVIHQKLPITEDIDIKISPSEIAELLEIKPSKILKTIIKDLEKKIIYLELQNDKEELINYIKKNYKK